ncbi:hypothetical protein, partial [Streptomyces sp. YIM 98790]|uniref:hypothetical protein n=1 Tax=Streptomyces sp. YIM 98790 TaxID=2689077 RepID=UPI001A9E55E0
SGRAARTGKDAGGEHGTTSAGGRCRGSGRVTGRPATAAPPWCPGWVGVPGSPARTAGTPEEHVAELEAVSRVVYAISC